ncbi:MAG: hypothetical protein ABI353_06380 [Isosphaeraceae bacterium]
MPKDTEYKRLLGRRLKKASTAFTLVSAVAISSVLAGCGGSSKPAPPPVIEATVVGTGVIDGRVTLEGTPTSEQELPLDAACSASAKKHNEEMPRFTRNYVTKDGGLAEVLVTLEGVAAQPIPAGTEPLTITQRGCEYEPYVAACQVGQTIIVHNDDPLTHNIHTLPAVPGNKEVNQSQAAGSKPLEFTVDKPEEFLKVKCDVHPWMFSYVSVLTHPFHSVTSEDGHFEIKGLPDGKYKVKFKHRKAGEMIQEVEVKDGKATADVVMKVPAA